MFLARPNRYQIMDLYKNDIILELRGMNDVILTKSEIESVLSENKKLWRLPISTTLTEFIEYLTDKRNILDPVHFGTKSRKQVRYIYRKKDIDADVLALSLYPNLHLSHYSAVVYHDLSLEIPKSIYISREKNKVKSEQPEIAQQDIDIAFTKPMRMTNNFLDYKKQRIYILNSVDSNELGIIERGNKRVTDIERTLIDITVRPNYSGGVYEVLNIFERAKKQISINRIITYLKKLNYSYPYHQSIGFYLEKSGYNNNALLFLEKSFPMKHSFYLTYNMKDVSYNNRWKIYHPKNF